MSEKNPNTEIVPGTAAVALEGQDHRLSVKGPNLINPTVALKELEERAKAQGAKGAEKRWENDPKRDERLERDRRIYDAKGTKTAKVVADEENVTEDIVYNVWRKRRRR